MPTPNNPEEKLPNSEAAFGGADAVQKTSYVVGKSAEPAAQQRKGEPIAQVRSGGGPNILAWVVGAIAALFALVYAAGLFR